MFKVNNKDTRTTSLMSIAEFQEVNADWVWPVCAQYWTSFCNSQNFEQSERYFMKTKIASLFFSVCFCTRLYITWALLNIILQICPCKQYVMHLLPRLNQTWHRTEIDYLGTKSPIYISWKYRSWQCLKTSSKKKNCSKTNSIFT